MSVHRRPCELGYEGCGRDWVSLGAVRKGELACLSHCPAFCECNGSKYYREGLGRLRNLMDSSGQAFYLRFVSLIDQFGYSF